MKVLARRGDCSLILQSAGSDGLTPAIMKRLNEMKWKEISEKDAAMWLSNVLCEAVVLSRWRAQRQSMNWWARLCFVFTGVVKFS